MSDISKLKRRFVIEMLLVIALFNLFYLLVFGPDNILIGVDLMLSGFLILLYLFLSQHAGAIKGYAYPAYKHQGEQYYDVYLSPKLHEMERIGTYTVHKDHIKKLSHDSFKCVVKNNHIIPK